MNVLTLIISYNFEPWMDRCLHSLAASKHPTDILVIDNASTDRTAERMKKEYPAVRFLQNGRNLGFGGANNIGLRMALAEGYDAVFLLNQDAWIDADTLGTLGALSARHPDYGILSPVHLDGSGRQPDPGFAAYTGRTSKEAFATLSEELVERPFINAAFWWMPVRTLRTVGGFSPLFYHYGEDKDYVNRLHYHGLKVGYSPRVFGCHDRAFRRPDRAAFFRTEQVYHLSEYANPNYPAGRAFAYGPLAALKKAAAALTHGQGNDTLAYLRISRTLLGQSRQVRQVRQTLLHPQPHFIQP